MGRGCSGRCAGGDAHAKYASIAIIRASNCYHQSPLALASTGLSLVSHASPTRLQTVKHSLQTDKNTTMLGSIASTSGRACGCRNGPAARRPVVAAAAPVVRSTNAAAARLRRAATIARAGLKEAALVPVMDKGELSQYPEQPGVYAVYDAAGQIQYIGLSRKVGVHRGGSFVPYCVEVVVHVCGGVHAWACKWRAQCCCPVAGG